MRLGSYSGTATECVINPTVYNFRADLQLNDIHAPCDNQADVSHSASISALILDGVTLWCLHNLTSATRELTSVHTVVRWHGVSVMQLTSWVIRTLSNVLLPSHAMQIQRNAQLNALHWQDPHCPTGRWCTLTPHAISGSSVVIILTAFMTSGAMLRPKPSRVRKYRRSRTIIVWKDHNCSQTCSCR